MKKKIFLSLILTISFLTSCSEKCSECAAGTAAITSFSDEMHEKNGWYLDSFGGAFDGTIGNLNLNYVICSEVNIDEARTLMIDGVERFVSSLNSNSTAKPYLKHFPFDYKDIQFNIAFCLPDGSFIRGGHVAVVSLINGVLGYSVYDEETNRLSLLWEKDEPYLDALEIVTNGLSESSPHIKIGYLENKRALESNSLNSPAYRRKLFVRGENLQRRFKEPKNNSGDLK